MVSALFEIDPATGSFGAAGDAQDVVAAGGVVRGRIADVSGINPGLISWTIFGTHGAAAPSISLSGTPVGQIASFTVPAGGGQAYGIRLNVNGGEAVTRDATTTAKSAVYVLNDSGRRPFFIGESFESDSVFGSVPRLNDISDAASAAQAVDYKASVRAATVAALPANTRTGNTLDADGNGALPTIDGVTIALNDRVLIKDEPTGLNHATSRRSSPSTR